MTGKKKLEMNAPAGKFRVVQIDIRAATGFFDDDPYGESCASLVRDCDSLEEAAKDVKAVPGEGRYCRQVHDETGRCLLYHDGERFHESCSPALADLSN